MTVGTQIKQTLASLKGSKATIQAYALHHPDPITKVKFSRCEEIMDEMIQELEERVKQIEFEEPQFKGY